MTEGGGCVGLVSGPSARRLDMALCGRPSPSSPCLPHQHLLHRGLCAPSPRTRPRKAPARGNDCPRHFWTLQSPLDLTLVSGRKPSRLPLARAASGLSGMGERLGRKAGWGDLSNPLSYTGRGNLGTQWGTHTDPMDVCQPRKAS